MNRKKERNPVPEGDLEQYLVILSTLAVKYGVHELSRVLPYHQNYVQAVEREIFEQEHKVSPSRKLATDTKKYVVIFKQRYLQLTDLEYTRQISPIDGRMMKQVTKALMDSGFEVDEYLKWIFEEFLVENPKFCPPNIKWSGSAFVLDKFLYEHKEKMREKKDAQKRKVEMLDLINRARVLMRGFVAAGRNEEKEKVKELLKKHQAHGIILKDFRQKIEAFEKQLRQQKAQEA